MPSKSRKKKQDNNKGLIIIIVAVIVIAAISIIAGWYVTDGNTEEVKTPGTEQTEEQVTVKTSLEGTWVSSYDGAMLGITGLSFTLELASVDKPITVQGSIVVKDSLVTFINTNAICKKIKGKYRFRFKEGDLVFQLIEDDCASRKERMTAGWFRL